MTIEELKIMFPGDWKYNISSYMITLYYGNKCILYFKLNNSFTLTPSIYDPNNICFNKSLSEAKIFYKKYFKMENFL